jgi:hypothetical protein
VDIALPYLKVYGIGISIMLDARSLEIKEANRQPECKNICIMEIRLNTTQKAARNDNNKVRSSL